VSVQQLCEQASKAAACGVARLDHERLTDGHLDKRCMEKGA